MRLALPALMALAAAPLAAKLDAPWIADTYFYWYSWDGDEQLGSWTGGIYNTPLFGYYDSRSVADNTRELHAAAEWGINVHFMDYWGPGWQGEGSEPREMTVMRATEAVRARGYPIFMGMYQDGEDFDMTEFSRNLEPGRDTHWFLDLLARHAAYPKHNGAPVGLIYGRNGTPKASAKDDGFRAWLQAKYGTLEALNARWGSAPGSWSEVKLDFSGGRPRYDSIAYQYAVWGEEWAKTNAAARQRWGLPGFLASWDIAYQPYLGYGYSAMNRVFVGPHSYAGIFGVPHEQSTERFIQAQVAKAYDSVFFDTFKNFYHDWEIRVPGTAYPPAFDAFDRFWANVLLNRSEALLHLSWNEWWEGSNLEPCLEFGKTYCEKNLLWASLMRQCFPSIQNWTAGARVAVLLNDWHWYVGGNNQADIHGLVAALRRSGAVFELVPDDFVTAEKLRGFTTVVAPAAGVGLGFNAAGEPILPLLRAWVEAQAGRKLVLSRVPGGVDLASRMSVAEWLGLKPAAGTAAASPPGPDQNLFVDVGLPGDDQFLISGASQREDWGRLPPESYGARTTAYTVRWTPAVGRRTLFVVPLSAHRDHIVRFGGSALWPNRVTVRLAGQPVGEVAILPGDNAYEIAIPAALVGDATVAELAFDYAELNIPTERDPARFPSEGRVCNLGLDYLQVATAGTPLSRENRYQMVEHTIRPADAAPDGLRGRTFGVPYAPRDRLAGGTTLTVNGADGTPRDVLCAAGAGQVWYCDGLLGTVSDPDYLASILAWAGVDGPVDIAGDDLNGSWLEAGDTTIVVVHNDAAIEPREVAIRVPERVLPLAEARVLTRNGEAFPRTGRLGRELRDTLTTCAAYQFAYSPVRVTTPPLDIVPGESRAVPVQLANLTDATVTGALGLGWHLPSLTAEPVSYALLPRQTKTIELTLVARDDCDWGAKTLVLELAAGARKCYLWRPLRVLKPAELTLGTAIVDATQPRLEVRFPASPLGLEPPAESIEVRLPDLGMGGSLRSLDPGDTASLALSRPPASELPVSLHRAVIRWRHRGQPFETSAEVAVARPGPAAPRMAGSSRAAWVYNPSDTPLEHQVVRLPSAAEAVFDSAGRRLPSRRTRTANEAIVSLPPRSRTLLYLASGADPVATDLSIVQRDLGTGRGEVTVRNSVLEVTWSESAGGTVTSLRTRANGREYAAANLGGIAYGLWGQFDPKQPAINSVNYLQRERKRHQADAPARIAVTDEGLRVRVAVRWAAGGARAEQVWTVPAYRPELELRASAEVARGVPEVDELVVADIHLRRHQYNKIYPNFTGVMQEVPNGGPHAGWREGPHLPDVATVMSYPELTDSLSIAVLGTREVNYLRQGLWPAKRPESGLIEFARVEYVARGPRRASADLVLLFHRGHQFHARREVRRRYLAPPLVLPAATAERPGPRASSVERDWWSPAWHHRAVVEVPPLAAAGEDLAVVLGASLGDMVPAGETIDPDSPRVLIDGRLVPAEYRPEADELLYRLPGAQAAGSRPRAVVYFDTLANGPKAPLRWSVRVPGGGVGDPGFERGGDGWLIQPPATVVDTEAHTGKRAVRLQRGQGMGPVVVQTGSALILPGARYRVAFWAKTATPGLAIRTNVFHPAHDPPQMAVPLTADNAWHRYEAELLSGDFPPSLQLMLRFWILDQVGSVLLDDIELTQLGQPTASRLTAHLAAP